MLDLCQQYQLFVTNGSTKSDAEGNLTFIGGQGTSVNDFCAVSGRWLDVFDDLKIEAKTYSDHLPLLISINSITDSCQVHLSLLPKLRWNVDHLDRYRSRLDHYLSNLNSNHLNISERTNELKNAIINSVTVSKRKYEQKKKLWFDNACINARSKSFAWLNLLRRTRSEECRQEYIKANAHFKWLCKKAKREYYDKMCRDIASSRDSCSFWRCVKQVNGTNFNFKISSDLGPNVLARHFEALLEDSNMLMQISYAPNYVRDETLDADIGVDELKQVLIKAKDNKAPGYDRISYEFFKNATDLFYERLVSLYNDILNTGNVPNDFKQAIIFPIFKKGDLQNPENYRGISFLNTIAKLFTGIILIRLEAFVKRLDLLSEAQAGFRAGYSTIDHVFTLSNLVNMAIKKGRKMYALFVDLKAAFDRINRRALLFKLRALQISSKIINVIEQLYTETTASVWNGKHLSNWFITKSGVRQGCLLSPLLFALFINDLIDYLPGGIQMNEALIKALLYADDICIVANTPEMLQLMMNKLAEYCKTWGLEVNLLKTKVLIFNKKGRRAKNEKWFFNGMTVEVTKQYKYLGILVTPHMDMKAHLEEKLKASLNAINNTWAQLLRNREVLHSAKYKVFIAAVKTIMFYGAEVWGIKPYEQVEKLLRYFIKRYFLLPSNSPNYMLMLETGLSPFYIDTLKAHVDYILKVLKYPRSRIAYQSLKSITTMKIGWYEQLMNLAEAHQTLFNIDDNVVDLKKQLYMLIEKVDLNMREEFIKQARDSQTRFLYSELNYNLNQRNYFNDNFSRSQISTIFRARGELLDLNYYPHRVAKSLECNLCNMRAREDVLHFIGKCPILRDFRKLIFGKSTLSLWETVEVLNGRNWKALVEYCTQAAEFRNDYNM